MTFQPDLLRTAKALKVAISETFGYLWHLGLSRVRSKSAMPRSCFTLLCSGVAVHIERPCGLTSGAPQSVAPHASSVEQHLQ